LFGRIFSARKTTSTFELVVFKKRDSSNPFSRNYAKSNDDIYRALSRIYRALFSVCRTLAEFMTPKERPATHSHETMPSPVMTYTGLFSKYAELFSAYVGLVMGFMSQIERHQTDSREHAPSSGDTHMALFRIFRIQRALSSVYMALLSVCRALLSVCMALLCVYSSLVSVCRALLSVHMALLSVYRALLSLHGALFSVYRGLLSVHMALLSAYRAHLSVYRVLSRNIQGVFQSHKSIYRQAITYIGLYSEYSEYTGLS